MISPTSRNNHSLAAIYGTDNVLLYGNGGSYNDTWVYDLSDNTWTLKDPLVNPKYKSDFKMASIYGTDNVLLFGGRDEYYFNDIWIYDLSENNWTQKTPPIKPEGRNSHALASIWGTSKALLFGGRDPSGPVSFNDTWVYNWDYGNWTRKYPLNNPSARFYSAMASIYSTDKVVLFGGYYLGWCNETWVYDLSNNTWTQKSPINIPIPRGNHGLATVHGTDKVVLFGGGRSYPNIYNDTWIYDLSEDNWTKLTTTISPSNRTTHIMASIYGTDKIMLFGGSTWGTELGDTWVLDLSSSLTSGTYISTAYDAGGKSSFKTLSWDANTSINTSIKFQLRSAASETGLAAKEFIGSDGTIYSYYLNSPATIWSGHHGDSWLQYKTYFSTNNTNETPSLKNVTINYNKFPTTQLISPGNNTIIMNNTPRFSWNFIDSDSTQQSAFQVQIDDNPAFLSIDYNSSTQSSTNQSWQFPNGTGYSSLGNGSWYWKVRTKDNDGDWGLFSSPFLLTLGVSCPNTTINIPQNNSILKSLKEIRGTTFYNNTTQQILNVTICIKRLSDDMYWNGSGWNFSKQWLPAVGNATWNYDSSTVVWTSGTQYIVRSRAADNLSHLETPSFGNVFTIDMTNPTSIIYFPANNTILNDLKLITGTASDAGGAGLKYVRIFIKRLSDNYYWSGSSWVSSIHWIYAQGTINWGFNVSNTSWSNGIQYLIRSKATDNVYNVEAPSYGNVFSFNTSIKPSSTINDPTNNSVIYNLNSISGMAWTPNMYTKINKVEITFERLSDTKYWNGTNWTLTKTWLQTSGTSNWNYKWNWTLNPGKYQIQSRATDNHSNLEDPKYGNVFTLKVWVFSKIIVPADNSTLSSLNNISGTAGVYYNNSKITKVEIFIIRLSDDKYWSGSSWVNYKTWLLVKGMTSWFYDSSSIPWTNNSQYIVRSRATDEFSNVESQYPYIRFTIKFSSPIFGLSSTITVPGNNTFLNKLTTISGTASTPNNSTTINKVEIIIKRLNDNHYWNGVKWNKSQSWLVVSGTNLWSYSATIVTWASGNLYLIRSRATNNLNVKENPGFGNLFLMDLNTPTSNVLSPSNNATLKELNIISGSATDTGGSGVFEVKVNIRRVSDDKSWSGSNWTDSESWLLTFGTTNWTFYSGIIPWKAGIKYNIRSRATDNANNVEVPSSGVVFTFISNATRPSSSITSPKHNSFLKSLTTISGTAAAAANLSISKVEISIRRWNDYYYWTGTGWSPVTHWLLTTGTGSWSYDLVKAIWSSGSSYNIRSRATDNLNIVEAPSSGIDFWFDNQPPKKLNISINSGNQYTNTKNVRLNLYAEDSESGISQMAFSQDHINWTTWESFKHERSITLSPTDGEKIIYFRVKDRANNIAIANDSIILDTMPPYSVTILINNGASVTNSTFVILNISALDNGSGIFQMAFSSNRKNWTAWENFSKLKSYNLSSGDGLKTVYLRVSDMLNNIANPVSATIILNTSTSTPSSTMILDLDSDGIPDDLDAFPSDPAASVDLDNDRYPDSWNSGLSEKDSTTGLFLDAFPDDPAASVDSDNDSYPDYWNSGMTDEDSKTGLHLDAFPNDPAASVDSDGDEYPDHWNNGMSEENSTTGLILDAYPGDPNRYLETTSGKKPSYAIVPVIIVIFIIIIILILAKLTSLTVKNRHRHRSEIKTEDKTLEKIKHDIIHGKTMDYMKLSRSDLETMLEENYRDGEVSEETLDYLEKLIRDSDKIVK